jgi:hypothetical protein
MIVGLEHPFAERRFEPPSRIVRGRNHGKARAVFGQLCQKANLLDFGGLQTACVSLIAWIEEFIAVPYDYHACVLGQPFNAVLLAGALDVGMQRQSDRIQLAAADPGVVERFPSAFPHPVAKSIALWVH